ncbi:MAG TPA: transketolase C-terminal domain-containing protein [Xanthobacteraceae bacterium]|nr:transketolase C-terminal domain-containing protein [Xanthobacteraceae bacterium]
MRKRSIDMVYELAKRDERVVFIGSDLSPGLLGEMKKAYPDRYYMEGIAEANIIGMAAGMAMEGFLPYVNTIATFITRRCYEQVAVDLCLHDLPVRLLGNGGGYVYAPLGPTHQAIEDIAIMRALPNMTVTAVCDAEEMTRLMTASLDWPHPIYIRLAKGGDPIVSREENGFAIGKAIDMSDDAGDADALVVSTGVATGAALDARKRLADQGVRCRVLHVHTVKPLDAQAVVAAARGLRLIVTVEEHSVIGGLGGAVLEALADTGAPMPPVRRLGIRDEFATHYGNQQKLMDAWGINADGIVAAVADGLARARP